MMVPRRWPGRLRDERHVPEPQVDGPASLASVLWSPTSVNICVMGDALEQHVDDADVVGQRALVGNEHRRLLVRDGRHVPEQHDGPDVADHPALDDICSSMPSLPSPQLLPSLMQRVAPSPIPPPYSFWPPTQRLRPLGQNPSTEL